jgi:hypothetical protein
LQKQAGKLYCARDFQVTSLLRKQQWPNQFFNWSHISHWYHKWCLLVVLFCLTANEALAANELAIGPRAKVSSIDITIERLIDLNFKTRAQLSTLRYRAVMKYPQLLAKQYAPDAATFGQIEDRKPWFGTLGLAYYGIGKDSIKGPSVQSMHFINPYLLVGDGTVGSLPKDKVTEKDLGCRTYPTMLQASNLKWYPQARRAEVTYEKTAYEKEMCAAFNYSNYTLSGQTQFALTNARDMGFNYVFIPPSWASNIHVGSPMKSAMPIPHFIHCGTSCGYPGGCNNLSPETAWLDNFTIEKLPAKIGFSFWINPPKTGREPPDMTFIVNYR